MMYQLSVRSDCGERKNEIARSRLLLVDRASDMFERLSASQPANTTPSANKLNMHFPEDLPTAATSHPSAGSSAADLLL